MSEVDFTKPTFSWVGYSTSGGMIAYAVNADDDEHAVSVGISRAAKDGHSVEDFARIETSELHLVGEGDDNGESAG